MDTDEAFIKKIINEARTMAELNHPNIVRLLENRIYEHIDKENGTKKPAISIALELATGGDLFDYVALSGRFNEATARFYFRQLIDALDYLHQRGFTHRDLKLENLLFDANFNLKIADFGFAAPVAGKDGSGTCKTQLGTKGYIAPEILENKPYIGTSVDLFACAVILFIMIT